MRRLSERQMVSPQSDTHTHTQPNTIIFFSIVAMTLLKPCVKGVTPDVLIKPDPV